MNSRIRMLALAAIIATGVGGSGCAPDAWSNRAASGMNAFINQINRVCYPVQLGIYRMAEPLQVSDQFDYWMDQTSRLYTGGLSPAAYRASIDSFFGAGNAATIDCIFAQLPPPGAR